MKISSQNFRLRSAGHWAGRILLACSLILSVPALAKESIEVEVNGLSGDLLTNVQANLTIIRQSDEESLAPERIRELHRLAEVEIARALEPFGYYRPEITTDLREAEAGNANWLARYNVAAGTQVPIETIAVVFVGSGAQDDALHQLSNVLPLRQETGLDHSRYESGKKELLLAVRELGYIEARYTVHRVEVDVNHYVANISLEIDTGARYVFGAITFDQMRFDPEYLAQYLILEEGAPFSQSGLSRQRSTLSKSGHFQEVTIELGEATNEVPPAIPLEIELQPYLPNRYRGRFGWGSDTGLGVQADWTRRFVGKRGHHFNLGGTVVEERNRLAADFSYVIPRDPIEGSNIEFGVRHESKDLTYKDVDLEEGGETRIATNLASAFWHFPDRQLGDFQFQSTAGMSLVGESYDVFEVLFGSYPDEAQDAIIENIGREAYETLAPDFEAIVPGVRFTLRRSDSPLYIRRGDYFNLEVIGADENLGSNISFWQLRLNTWNIWSVGEGNRVLLRSAVGYSDAESRSVLGVNFNQMPEYFEFRAGGARSVRGYGYETLFPSDAITGGKHQLVASVEYEHEIIPDWSAAVFVDGGNAFNDFDDIDAKLGVGLGVRWRSPVGLARIDLGFPLDDADESFQIYITIGPEF